MTAEEKITVEIFGGVNTSSCGCGCSGGCGAPSVGADLEKRVAEITAKLREHFGDKVEVKYVDTAKVGIKDYPTLQRVVAAGYSFPFTFVNGEPRLAGDIDFEDVEDIIEEEMAS